MDGLVFYAKATSSRPRPRPDSPKEKATTKAKKFGLKAKD